MIEASRDFVPVFIDTLNDLETTQRFGESYGSYPVLRVFDREGQDLAGRIDTNTTAGIVSSDDVLEQLARGLQAFSAAP